MATYVLINTIKYNAGTLKSGSIIDPNCTDGTRMDPVSTSDFTAGNGFSLGGAVSATGFVLACDGVVEAPTSLDVTEGVLVPASNIDGTKEFSVLYAEPHSHTVAAHTHPQTVHNHPLT